MLQTSMVLKREKGTAKYSRVPYRVGYFRRINTEGAIGLTSM